MARTDSTFLAHDAAPASPSGSVHLGPGPGQTDLAPGLPGDLGDAGSANWESAWIDLGGEG